MKYGLSYGQLEMYGLSDGQLVMYGLSDGQLVMYGHVTSTWVLSVIESRTTLPVLVAFKGTLIPTLLLQPHPFPHLHPHPHR